MRAFVTPWLALLCGLAVCGCGSNYAPGMDAEEREEALAGIKEFDAFDLYYPGKRIAGMNLTGVSGEDWQPGRYLGTGPSFSYGRCELPGGLFAEGGCSLPLSIQNWSTCSRWAGIFSDNRRRADLFDFRGAKAAPGEGGSVLEIFTGRTTVVVWAHDASVGRLAARRLRGLTETRAPATLPPPAPGSLRGKLPCQGKRG